MVVFRSCAEDKLKIFSTNYTLATIRRFGYFCPSSKSINMKVLLLPLAAIVMLYSFNSCSSSSGPQSFCDTVCLKDSLKFTAPNNPLMPHLYISAKNCAADTISWGYEGMGAERKSGMADMMGDGLRINPDALGCYIKDTSYIWLAFNDCSSGRGYLLKVPFDKKGKIERKSSAVNAFDPKFAVDESLVAYTDRGNIFVEEKATGKKAMMTFGQALEIDYDNFHKTLDSVNITPTRIWIKINIENEWKELEKTIELK